MISLETKIMETEQYIINTEEQLRYIETRINRATKIIEEFRLRREELTEEQITILNSYIEQFNIEIDKYNEIGNDLNSYKALVAVYYSLK